MVTRTAGPRSQRLGPTGLDQLRWPNDPSRLGLLHGGMDQQQRDRVMGRLRDAMRPEFLNRIDEIVLFRKLEKEQLEQIVALLLGATRVRLAAREVSLEIDDTAIAWLAENGYEPEYGARPLRRLIQREVDDRIADLFVSGELSDGGMVRLAAREGMLRVAAVATVAAAA